MLKYANFRVLAASIHRSGSKLVKDAHRAVFDYTPRDGFLYVRSRAISSRCNDNFDEFPADEISKAYLSFVGKPVFVNHNNDNHRRARGVIVSAVLHDDLNPDSSPDTWVEVLMEVDAIKFPMLAKAILSGEIDRTSMGTDVSHSICSVCGNKASTPLEYCQHIPKMKGMKVRKFVASGQHEEVLCREICYGLKFFENSLLVEDPADPTAFFLGVDDRGLGGGYEGNLKEHLKVAGSSYSALNRKFASKTAGWVRGDANGENPDTWWSIEGPAGDGSYSTEFTRFTNSRPVEEGYQWYFFSNDDEMDGVGYDGMAASPEKAKEIVERLVSGRARFTESSRDFFISQKVARVTKDQAADADKALESSGGFTMSAHNETVPKKGYMVSLRGHEQVKSGDVTPTDIRQYAKSKKKHLRGGDRYLGGWVDEGKTYLDTSQWVKDRKEAEELGRKHGQLAIYDLKSKQAVSLAKAASHTPTHRFYIGIDPDDLDDEGICGFINDCRCGNKLGFRVAYAPGDEVDVAWPTGGPSGKIPDGKVVVEHDDPETVTVRSGGGPPYQYVTVSDESFDHAQQRVQESEVAPQRWMNRPWMAAQRKAGFKVARKHAYGETVAPPQVDTLRDEMCPICGNDQNFDGDECQMCGYKAAPDFLSDPDLTKAQEIRDESEVEGGGELPQEGEIDGEEGEFPDGVEEIDEELAEVDLDEEGDPTEDQELAELLEGQQEQPPPSDKSSDQPVDQSADDEDDKEDDEDEEDDEDDKWRKKLPKSGFVVRRPVPTPANPHKVWKTMRSESMRPALRAIADIARRQQVQLDAQQAQIDMIARLAGVKPQVEAIKHQAQRRIAALPKLADEMNPAQPVPEPAAQPAPASTPETLGDVNNAAPAGGGSLDSVVAPGGTSETNVAPAMIDTVMAPGTSIPAVPAVAQDVTAPVAGTQEPVPTADIRTEVDVEFRGLDTETAYPMTPAFSDQQTVAARTFAAIRLARLRVTAGIAQGDDIILGQTIATSKMSDREIAHEIDTLEAVLANQPKTAARQQGRNVERTVPSLATAALLAPPEPMFATASSGQDDALFE